MTSNMPLVSLVYGAMLVAIGLIGYFATGQASVTALIPAFLGAIAVVCGIIGRKEHLLKHAMHGAALVGLVGILGTARVLPQLPALLAGSTERPAAVLAQGLTLLLSIGFMTLCVRSFIEARRARASDTNS